MVTINIPLSKPDCAFIGVSVEYKGTELMAIWSKSQFEVMCGMLRPWSILSLTQIKIKYYRNLELSFMRPFGFYIRYVLQDERKLFVKQTDNYMYRYQGTMSRRYHYITHRLGVWLGILSQYWHIMSPDVTKIITANCTIHWRSPAKQGDKIVVTFYDGPGPLSPVITEPSYELPTGSFAQDADSLCNNVSHIYLWSLLIVIHGYGKDRSSNM
jgi:hypothetical protein